MSLKNTNPIILLLFLCILAVIFGIAGGYVFLNNFDEDKLVGNVEELQFSENLLTKEMKVIIEEVNASYPGSVERRNGDVVLVGYDAIDKFDNLSYNMGIEMVWELVPVQGEDIIFVQNIDYMPSEIHIYSSSDDFFLISYNELGRLLNGDEITAKKFRKILSDEYGSEWNESNWEFVELNES